MPRYDYVYDALGRRASVVMTGSAFSSNGGDHHWRWGYNGRNELDMADRHEGTDPENPGTRMIPGDYDYYYDNIGNRGSYRVDADPYTAYTTNNLNQYTATSYPTASFDYDHAGNLLQDRLYTYTWDAENRLVSAEISNPDLGSADKRLVFSYDYMGRRVRKQIFAWDNKGEEWQTTPEQDWLFVYDGWNVIMVLDAQNDNATVRKYTWGLDLSGWSGSGTPAGIHGAGGIGGLLAADEPQTVGESMKFWYLYDANGNVGQILRNYTGYPIYAHYEYDAYGNTLVAAGPYAAVNPIRFSTKWLDYELGKLLDEEGEGPYYYGYRYYSPRLGRWLSRDPIAEKGGYNLYQFVSNAPIIHTDSWGLSAAFTSRCGDDGRMHIDPIWFRIHKCEAPGVFLHELVHVADMSDACRTLKECVDTAKQNHIPETDCYSSYREFRYALDYWSECRAYLAEVAYLRACALTGGLGCTCGEICAFRLETTVEPKIKEHCPKAKYLTPTWPSWFLKLKNSEEGSNDKPYNFENRARSLGRSNHPGFKS